MAPKRSSRLKRPASVAKAAPKPAAARSESKGGSIDGGSEEGFTITGSLDEKLAVIKASEAGDPQKVKMLQTALSTDDWTKLNMRANYAASKDGELGKDFEEAQKSGGRSERRNVICGWVLDPTRGKCYTALRSGARQEQAWEKEERWRGRNSFVPSKWSDHEFDMLVQSGRIWERPICGCPGLYEYYDAGDESVTRVVKKRRSLEWHQSEDIEPGTDHAEQVQNIMDQVHGFDLRSMGGALWDKGGSMGGSTGGGKGKGGKGKGGGSGGKPLKITWAGGPSSSGQDAASEGGENGVGGKSGGRGRGKGSKGKAAKNYEKLMAKVMDYIRDAEAALYHNGKSLPRAVHHEYLAMREELLQCKGALEGGTAVEEVAAP